jgi:hypothetical protein
MQFITTTETTTARNQPDLALCAWVGSATPGATFEYYRGDLALDRTRFGRFGNTPARAALALVAGWALELAERGFVHLVQRRHGPHDYSYHVVAAARRTGGSKRHRERPSSLRPRPARGSMAEAA